MAATLVVQLTLGLALVTRPAPLQFHARAPRPLLCAPAAALEPPPPSPAPSPPLSPRSQLLILLPVYWAQVSWLSRATLPHSVVGWLGAAGARMRGDTLVGVGVVAAAGVACYRRTWPAPRAPPWTAAASTRRLLLIETYVTLVVAFLLSPYVSDAVQHLLYLCVWLGAPLSKPSLHALQVLLSHLLWIAVAARVLGTRLGRFFPPPFSRGAARDDDDEDDDERWVALRWRAPWLWWALGGYFCSGLVYGAAEGVTALLPTPPTDNPVVQQLLHPEGGDRWALAIGAVGPCVTAPVFEELLYRGFLLPALLRFAPLRFALPAQALLFGLHHQTWRGLLPISALGALWALLYVQTGNLVVPIAVHAMWNAKIFLHAVLGVG